MNKIRKTILLLSVTIMLTLSSLSMASTENSEMEAEVNNIITEIVSKTVNLNKDQGGDYFHIWIAQLFGDFIFAPWDYPSDGVVTVLSHTVGFTNILAMILGVVIVYYVLLGGALNTAHSGEALGKQWSSVWIPIRTGLGFSLIMPLTTVGGGVFSVAQMLIVWLIILGSNAATVLWESTVDYIFDSSAKTSISLKMGMKPVTDISKILACTQDYMDAVATGVAQDEIDSKGKLIANIYTATPVITGRGNARVTPPVKVYSNTWNSSISAYSIEGGNFSSEFSKLDKVTKVTFASNGRCGTINVSKQSLDSDFATDHDEIGYKEKALNNGFKETKKAIGTTLDSLSDFLVKYLGEEKLPITTLDERNTKNPSGDYKADVIIYHDIVADFNDNFINNVKSAMINDESTQSWIDSMKSGGWAKAGIWFYDIGAIDQMTGTIIKSFKVEPTGIAVCKPEENGGIFSFFSFDICKEMLARSSVTRSIIEILHTDAVQYAVDNGITTSVTDEDTIIGECPEGSICSPKGNMTQTASVSTAKFIINVLAAGSDMTERGGGLSNPFQTVTSIGNSLNLTAETLFIAGSVANGMINGSTLSATGSDIARYTGMSFILGSIKGVFEFSSYALFSFITVLLGTGFTLAYALPFLPVVTWILMMTGYLITVVEAVIAAPLAIILMVTPEGDGISGTRLERAMSLIAVAVLKPSLMIIGMIAAITVSGVSFAIMNEFFFEAASKALMGNVLDFVAIIIVYTMTSLQLCKLLISVMHTLPTQILDWFSSGTGRTFGEDSASQGAESATGSMGQFAQKVGASSGGVLSKSLSDRKEATSKARKGNKTDEDG